jgi:hypothetical protein
MSRLIDVDSEVRIGKAETTVYKADTIMMLSVIQYIPDVKRIFFENEFQCDNIILDSWEELEGVHLNDIIAYLESKGFILNEKHQWDDTIKDENYKDRGNRYILHFNRQARETSVI